MEVACITFVHILLGSVTARVAGKCSLAIGTGGRGCGFSEWPT